MISINKWLKQESGHIEMSENKKILQRFWFISTKFQIYDMAAVFWCVTFWMGYGCLTGHNIKSILDIRTNFVLSER